MTTIEQRGRGVVGEQRASKGAWVEEEVSSRELCGIREQIPGKILLADPLHCYTHYSQGGSHGGVLGRTN